MKKKLKIKIKKDTSPGFRVPTAKGSIRFKSVKDYDRKKLKEKLKKEIE